MFKIVAAFFSYSAFCSETIKDLMTTKDILIFLNDMCGKSLKKFSDSRIWNTAPAGISMQLCIIMAINPEQEVFFFPFFFIETQIVSISVMEVVFTDDGGPSIVSKLNQPKHK